jgi:hypothetical protein
MSLINLFQYNEKFDETINLAELWNVHVYGHATGSKKNPGGRIHACVDEIRVPTISELLPKYFLVERIL